MTFAATVLADSLAVNLNRESRLLSLLMTYPTIVHAEHLRHRGFSFSVASMRAIPIEFVLQQVRSNPFVPIHWGAAQSGMQAHAQVSPEQSAEAERVYHTALSTAIQCAEELQRLGLHKQVANRLLSPFTWTTTICTGNMQAWWRFWTLRCHDMAEPHIRKIAELSREAVARSHPVRRREAVFDLRLADWHLPLVTDAEREDKTVDWHLVSAARCARVSYCQHDGQRDIDKDLKLANRLIVDNHWSPFEHQACFMVQKDARKHGNLGKPWIQHRKCYDDEYAVEAP